MDGIRRRCGRKDRTARTREDRCGKAQPLRRAWTSGLPNFGAVLVLALALALGAAPAWAQTLPDVPPAGPGVFVIGYVAGAPVELGAVHHFSWYSASVSLMPGGDKDPTRVVAAAGAHVSQGPVRLYARAGAGYEWDSGEGRPVIRFTYGSEVALTGTIQLILQGATSVAAGSSGWTRSEQTRLTAGIQLFLGPSASDVRRAALQETHAGWPPELVELVADGVVPEALAQAHYPEWSVEQLRLVAQGKVAPGMTPEMVAAVLGQPDEIVEGTDPALGPVLLWRYYETVGRYDAFTGKPTYRQELRRTVVFRGGVAARIE